VTVYLPANVSEVGVYRPGTRIETTCTLCAGTAGAAKASRGRIPATVAEMTRLWYAVGRAFNGYTSAQLRTGQQALYRHGPEHRVGSAGVWRTDAADQALGIVTYGDYQQLPAAIREAGHQPGYDGGHAIYHQAEPRGTGWSVVNDPLATVTGTRVRTADLEPFARSHNYEHDVYREGAWKTMITVTVTETWDPPGRVLFPAGAKVAGYQLDRPAPVKRTAIGPKGSSAHAFQLATVAQAAAGDGPAGAMLHMTDGYFADLWVPSAGLTLPPSPASAMRAAVEKAARDLQQVKADLDQALG